MKKHIINFFKDESGATMVEYGIMVALIAVVSIVIIGVLGNQIQAGFAQVSQALTDAGIAPPVVPAP